MSAWAQHYPGFLELKDYDIAGTTELPDGRVEVAVSVTGRHAKEPRDYVFIMKMMIVLGAERLVRGAVHRAELDAGGRELLRSARPLRRQRLAVPAPRREELHHPEGGVLQHLGAEVRVAECHHAALAALGAAAAAAAAAAAVAEALGGLLACGVDGPARDLGRGAAAVVGVDLRSAASRRRRVSVSAASSCAQLRGSARSRTRLLAVQREDDRGEAFDLEGSSAHALVGVSVDRSDRHKFQRVHRARQLRPLRRQRFAVPAPAVRGARVSGSGSDACDSPNRGAARQRAAQLGTHGA